MIAKMAMHTKEKVGRINALIAMDGKRASEEKWRRIKAKLNFMLAERVKSLLVEARRTWFAEEEEKLRRCQFLSDLNRMLEEATGLQEFKAGLAEEEKLRRWVSTVLNPMIAK
eukprot:CAMPEP_0185749446 /NCGR_PEP_ID=MMETSP1174-20130828/8143_1 /TAXON_ID=35687 /ORGANISM="Dictyocha speculum, Strain CCMP1381" /LENGTH=112 /DNA_ID=CAMNT_0028425557 /DNA_START=60 /DNA_END=395 /DNA_ORIENTATION=-